MTTAIEKAKSHFREQVKGTNLEGPIRVEEWDLEIFFKKKINLNQMSEITQLIQSGKTFEGVVVGIIIRALDEDGKPIFKKADKVDLMRSADPDVVMKIAQEMGDVFSDLGDQLGN